MKKIFLIVFLVFIGCSTKDTFIPKKTEIKKLKQKSDLKELYDYTKKTLTFRELDLNYSKPKSFIDDGVWGRYVFYTLDNKKLGKFKLVNKNLAVFGEKLLIIDKNRVITLPYMVLRATQKDNIIALVFENNSIGIYDLDKNKLSFYKKFDDVLSVKYLSQSPLFYHNLLFFPLLNGSVGVYSLKENKYINTLAIADGAINNNVIFLKIVNNQLFMATPSKLVLFNPNFLIDYKAEIKHIISDDKFLYLFLVNGEIVKLDTNLKKVKKTTLKFADYFAPDFCNNKIYTITKRGYLIEISKNLEIKVYEGNNFDTNMPLKIKQCKIYNDNKVYFIE